MKKLLLLLGTFCLLCAVCKSGEISYPNNPLSKYKCASNEILYISESCSPINLEANKDWGVKLKSNTYGEDGIGRLKFDAAVTSIPDSAFYDKDLRYIKMPDRSSIHLFDAFQKIWITCNHHSIRGYLQRSSWHILSLITQHRNRHHRHLLMVH